MTTPIENLDVLFPKAVVLNPAWSDTTARVMAGFQDETSDKVHRFFIPAGTSTVMVSNTVRFTATLKIIRGTNTEVIVGDVPTASQRVFQVAAESDVEAFITLSGAPNTNDAAVSRIGVQIVTVP